jgi:hypothetical protein
MKLSEWNSVLAYADAVLGDLWRKHLSVSYKMYSSYCNPNMKGLSFKLVDSHNELFKEFSTGSWLTPKEYIWQIDRVKEQILNA